MRAYKILALVRRDLIIFTRSKWKLVEFFYFPITTLIIWGLFAFYTRGFALETGLMILGVNVFWSFCYIAQSTTNLQMFEDMSSGSLRHVLASGITEFEYIGARLISSALISVPIFAIMLILVAFFGLTTYLTELPVVLGLACVALLAAMAMSLLIAALIIYLGREYGFLAWIALQLFVLLSAPFYPPDILPTVLRFIALLMPFTYVFAAARALATTGAMGLGLLLTGLVVALAYTALAIPLYHFSFKRARRVGELARMD
jgi:ABC-2 type transport system permease protein